MFGLFKKLYQVNLLSPKGLFFLLGAIIKHGPNLLAVVQFITKIEPSKIAIKDERTTFSYAQLFESSNRLAVNLKAAFSFSKNYQVAFLCKNHNVCFQSLIACSRLGANITFLNVDMSGDQIARIIQQKDFDLIIYDNEFEHRIKNLSCNSIPCFKDNGNSIEALSAQSVNSNTKLKRRKSGNISVLTGGTSGNVKVASRKPSILNLILPFLSLLNLLELNKYKTVYIGVPVFHGYGLASFTVALVLGSSIFTLKNFKTKEAVHVLHDNKIEIAILVPTMLKRMLHFNSDLMKSIRGILSGGAPLKDSLVQEVFNKLGPVLFNLYGTSEAGFSVLATPNDLQHYPSTIGRKIRGVSLKIVDDTGTEVQQGVIGIISIQAAWSMKNRKDRYVSTGDYGYRNQEGFLFLKGREDDMIVSGGENVYPKDIELKLLENPQIDEAVVLGFDEENFGKRLIAFVVPKTAFADLDNETIRAWLTSKIARYQMPYKIIVRDTLPMLKTGKIDKKSLLNEVS